jgi:two-component system, response regulator YesN
MDARDESFAGCKEILCIEEHGEICLLLSKMLDSREFKVSHAKDIQQAAVYLTTRIPALVLIEDNFFGEVGITYIAELKHKLPETKIVMLSAEGGPKKEAARKAGVDVFLTKPFTKMQLVRSVVTLISKSENV